MFRQHRNQILPETFLDASVRLHGGWNCLVGLVDFDNERDCIDRSLVATQEK